MICDAGEDRGGGGGCPQGRSDVVFSDPPARVFLARGGWWVMTRAYSPPPPPPPPGDDVRAGCTGKPASLVQFNTGKAKIYRWGTAREAFLAPSSTRDRYSLLYLVLLSTLCLSLLVNFSFPTEVLLVHNHWRWSASLFIFLLSK